ncbi:MAG: ABC transporter substrate-binding protein [Candidatus Promineifilaceae bacterium]
MGFKNRLLALFIILCVTVGLMACRQAPLVVKIGLVGPFEGQYRAVGYDAIYSARLAVREVNEAGGIGRIRLALVALDDGSNPEMASQVANSLVLDPDVVAVVGDWLPETTTAAAPVYQEAGLPFLQAGERPFVETAPQNLPAGFLTNYAAVTPFDETAGPYAGAAYDAFYLLVKAMEAVDKQGEAITRQTVAAALQNLRYEGITGEVYQP